MNEPQDPEAAETVQATNAPAVDQPRLVSLKPSVDVKSASDKAEIFLLNYTASGKWEDMEGIEWNTADVHEALTKFIRENADDVPPR